MTPFTKITAPIAVASIWACVVAKYWMAWQQRRAAREDNRGE